MNISIIIPARYGSTRFPGKPLVKIAGQSMLSRVVDIAKQSAIGHDTISIVVATEDERILKHAEEIGVHAVMTSDNCATGSDRVLEAVLKTNPKCDFVFGLQGDAPFTPANAISTMIDAVKNNPDIQVITPVINLRWSELDALKHNKKQTPFSGTTAIINHEGQALWFSKNIIPAIRNEEKYKKDEYSPVYQHLGLYGFQLKTLEKFVALPQGKYEKLEGLEQLRLLENDIPIHTVTLDVEAGLAQAGIDSPEDVTRAEKILEQIK